MSSLQPNNQTEANAGPVFDNSYARLPERFFAPAEVAVAPDPRLLALNGVLAGRLGISADWLRSNEGLAVLAGQVVAAGSEPIAMAYAGHQFGQFVPQLGDGRAALIGEVIGTDGVRRDLQFKGAGRTDFSRNGDGQAALGPVLREYLVSEAMAALGVPTTRALAAITTGLPVFREKTLAGARIVRVAESHVRVGTFQYFAARGDVEALKALSDYVIARHYPEVATAERPALALVEAVVHRQAKLIAQWQSFGFIHGVMNTDNMSVAAETIDYGPCAFMDHFDPAQVYSSIDRGGRYAYQNQPGIGQWNLAMLAGALLPLIDADEDKAVELAQGAIDHYAELYQQAYLERFAAKLGLTEDREGDEALIGNLMGLMAAGRADFTLTFRTLADAIEDTPDALLALFEESDGGEEWLGKWRARLAEEGRSADAVRAAMQTVNPLYIPRNHLVEEMIVAAYEGDFGPFEQLMEVLSDPFTQQDGRERYALPPEPEEVVAATFCGT